MNTFDTGRKKALLAFLDTDDRHVSAIDEEETAALADSAGMDVVGTIRQARPHPEPASYFGTGKIEEIALAVEREGVDVVVVGGELTPAQESRLEDGVGAAVLDRREVILDIFAQRAMTAEGRLQVELAQLAFRRTRLRDLGKHLSRLGGGIGTRGPGETKLEQDRQRIERRMADLRRKIEDVRQQRATARRSRLLPELALLGYTNAGKTSLLGRLAEHVPAGENRLFATLDPLTRAVRLPSGENVLVSDTVGFIRDLPHTLVAAFRATLEAATEADGWIFVLDLASGDVARQEEAIRGVMAEIGAEARPTLRVYHKADTPSGPIPNDGVAVSSLTGEGIPELLAAMEDLLAQGQQIGRWLIPFTRGDVLDRIHRQGIVLEERHEEGGTLVVARLNPAERKRLDARWEVHP